MRTLASPRLTPRFLSAATLAALLSLALLSICSCSLTSAQVSHLAAASSSSSPPRWSYTASLSGDARFVGLRGQRFQPTAAAMRAGVYSLLADGDVQMRGTFQMQPVTTRCSNGSSISSSERQIDVQCREDACGLRLVELGVQSQFGQRFRVAAGESSGNDGGDDSDAGPLQVTLDDHVLKIGAWMLLMSSESPSLEEERRWSRPPLQAAARNSSHSASIAVGEWELQVSSSGFGSSNKHHLRLQLRAGDDSDRSALLKASGLLGQTASHAGRLGNAQVEDSDLEPDYAATAEQHRVRDGRLFGDFKSNTSDES